MAKITAVTKVTEYALVLNVKEVSALITALGYRLTNCHTGAEAYATCADLQRILTAEVNKNG